MSLVISTPSRTPNWFATLSRNLGLSLAIAILIACSCATGILIGHAQEQFRRFSAMKVGIEAIIASDPEFISVTCYESSSCHLSVQGTLTDAQQKRFKDLAMLKVGEVHSEQFTFNFKTPSQ
jgi:catabolite regulation protein CreA